MTSKRQQARIEFEQRILEMMQSGATDTEIIEGLGCSFQRVQDVRQSNKLFKINTPDKYYPRVDDSKTEEKPIVGVKYEYKGKKYIDITGDIVDCGIAYRRK